MQIPKCSRCGNIKIFLRYKGSQIGMYCNNCGRWHKWAGKADVKALNARGFKVFREDYVAPCEREDYGVENLIEAAARQVGENVRVVGDYVVDSDGEIIADNSVKEETNCTVCLSGTLDSISSTNVAVFIFDGALTLYDKVTNKIISAYKLTHCPGCGKKY